MIFDEKKALAQTLENYTDVDVVGIVKSMLLFDTVWDAALKRAKCTSLSSSSEQRLVDV